MNPFKTAFQATLGVIAAITVTYGVIALFLALLLIGPPK